MIRNLLLTGIFLSSCTFAFAQASGSIDTSFSDNGSVTTNIGFQSYVTHAQAIQSDGKIIIVGRYQDTFYSGSFVSRLNADGTLDTSFNGTGKIRIQLEFINTVKIQNDGKIVVGGSNECVMRFTTAGNLDTTFNTTGYVFYPDSNNTIVDLVIQSDGKILALSDYKDFTNNVYDIKMARYNQDGATDSSFDGDGSRIVDLGSREIPRSISLQSDGKIVTGGSQSVANLENKFFIARFNSDGSSDISFNGNGIRTYAFANATNVASFGVTVLSNGKMVTAGRTTLGTQGDFTYLARFNSNGTLDTTFATSGIYTTAVTTGGTNAFNRVKVRNDGKIVLAGTSYTNDQRDIILRRFNSNGTPDAGFGTSGIVTFSYFNGDDNVTDFDLIGNKILMTGYTEENATSGQIAIATLNDNGSLDTIFSNDGKAFVTSNDPGADISYTVITQADGKVLVGGSAFANRTERLAIVRYNADGTLDTTFGAGTGKFVSSKIGHVSSIAIDSNGKIVIVGYGGATAGILRLNPDGSLDTTFATGGSFELGEIEFATELNSVAIQPNGKIVIGGSFVDFSTGEGAAYRNFSLIRLNTNGTYDNTFGTNGIALINISGNDETIKVIHILNNGKIVAAGEMFNGNDNDVAVLRFNSNGTPDTSFNGNGISTYDSGFYDNCHDMALQADGKMVVAVPSALDAFALLRFMPDGSADTNFGNNGISSLQIQDGATAYSVKIMPNQKIVAVGNSVVNDVFDFNVAIARFNTDGSPDTGFGINGKATVGIPGRDVTTNSCVLTDNKVIVASTIYDADHSTSDLITARFYLDDVLAVENFETETNLFYPNPVINSIKFDTEVVSATVYDSQGKQLPALFVNNEMDLTKLSSGIYVAQIMLRNGKMVSRKLLKK